jgi:hypothetical protein
MISRNSYTARPRALLAACLVVGAASIPGVAIALQQQVIGGHALDANLRVDGSGLNTARASNRVGGLQSNAYSARREYGGGGAGLSSQAYRPASVDTRNRSGGLTLQTGSGAFTTGNQGRGSGRVDPLRNSQYSVLQTGAFVERGVIPGGGRSAASAYGMTTPRPNSQLYGMTGGGRAPSTGLSSTRYSVARHR